MIQLTIFYSIRIIIISTMHERQEKLFRSESTIRREDDNIPPQELSGDQNEEEKMSIIMEEPKKANLYLTSMLIAKTAFGAGIISMPHTVHALGYIMAPLAFVLFFVVNQFCSNLLLKCKNLSRHSNYSTIIFDLFKKKNMRVLVSSIICIDNFSTCILFFILIKSSIRNMIKYIIKDCVDGQCMFDQYHWDTCFILVPAIAILPLLPIRKIENLKFASFFGVTGIIVFIIGLAICFVQQIVEGQLYTIEPAPTCLLESVSAIFNIAFAFSFQINFYPIFKGLKRPTDIRMRQACVIGLLHCGIPYITVGFLACLMMASPQANFLKSLKDANIGAALFFVIVGSFIFSLLFSIVLYFFSLRNNFISLVNMARRKMKTIFNNQSAANIEAQQSQLNLLQDFPRRQKMRKEQRKQFIIINIILYVSIMVVSIFIKEEGITKVFNFLGAVCQTFIVILLPCMFYVMLVNREKQPRNINYYLAIVLVVVMIPCSLFSVVASYSGEC